MNAIDTFTALGQTCPMCESVLVRPPLDVWPHQKMVSDLLQHDLVLFFVFCDPRDPNHIPTWYDWTPPVDRLAYIKTVCF